ncbi:AmpG family muropeptide MFS transporter [Rhodoferax aquaticus]|uniref:Permease n=1 Tax=Rhodoferax aquaticus TaxID=2527691 RepID=A0A515EUN4_9BURK|nr:AmpG family muropeptide MFS transporter [Rhodoferax aquaticus]QDL56392.1 permease [Rhodoferax aquaticus]
MTQALSPSPAAPPKLSWAQSIAVYLKPGPLRMLALGFAAGLPLWLVYGGLGTWLAQAGVNKATIGQLSLVTLAYTLKWLWAPLVDRLPIPRLTRWLGQRRSWLILAQILIMLGLTGMGSTEPLTLLTPMVWCALLVAFSSATQDLALDAFRIESADETEQAALAATYLMGYRLAAIWSGAFLLSIVGMMGSPDKANYLASAWQYGFYAMAASMLVGIVAVAFSKEPVPRDLVAQSNEVAQVSAQFASQGLAFSVPLGLTVLGIFTLLFSLVLGALSALSSTYVWLGAGLAIVGCVCLDRSIGTQHLIRLPLPKALVAPIAWLNVLGYTPLADFLRRYGRHGMLILALIGTYRISDVVLGVMANPFYVELKFTNLELAGVTKVYGVIMTLVGAFIAGAIAPRVGVMRVMMLGAVFSALTNFLFVWLGHQGHDLTALTVVISADNLAGGIATAAFIAYLSALTNIKYTVTQYALLSSVMVFVPKLLGGYSGVFVETYGFDTFFTGTALLGIPVLALVWLASKAKLHTDIKKP